MDLYAFKREVPLTTGTPEDRDKYFVYAYDQVQAYAKYKERNPDLPRPEFIGRRRA